MIYLDNTATSWPKPPEVLSAMAHFMNAVGANPGRSGHHTAVEASRIVYNTRELAASLFHCPDPLRVIFTGNVTESLNLALHGLLRDGDHIITSSMEHNSMMRPLLVLSKRGVSVTVVPCSSEGFIDPHDIEKAVTPATKMVAINHVSNVTGTIQPTAKIGSIARKNDLLFLTDTAQSAGVLDIDMQRDSIDLVAFTGHKHLLGPMGTGGLVIGERVDTDNFQPLKTGGTGSNSTSELQPDFLPDMFEGGTLNAVGLAGLSAGIEWIRRQKTGSIRALENRLAAELIDGLNTIRGVRVYGPDTLTNRTGTVSFTIAHISNSDAGMLLDEKYGILCRVGLHCSPRSHQTIGTFPEGTVRFGLGCFNTHQDIADALNAVEEIAGKK